MKNTITQIGRLFSYVKPQLLPYTFTTVIVGFRNFIIVFLNAYLLASATRAARSFDTGYLIKSVLLFLLFLVAFILLDTLGTHFRMIVTHNMTSHIRQKMHEKVVNVNLLEFDKLGSSRSDVLSRVNNDMKCAESILNDAILMPLMSIISGIGAFISIFSTNWLIGLYLLVIGMVIFAFHIMMSKKQRDIAVAQQKTLSKIHLVLNEIYNHNRNIRISNMITIFQKRMMRSLNHFDGINVKEAKLQAAVNHSTAVTNMLQFVGVIGIGLVMVIHRTMEIEDLVFINQLAGLAITMFITVSTSLIALKKSMAGVERMVEILNLPEESLEESNEKIPFGEGRYALYAEGFAVAFSNHVKINMNCPIRVPAGKMVAIYGKSGSGKSTFCRVLLKLFDYCDYSIKFWGQELRECSTKDVRDSIAYVAQENMIISGTIYDNIILGYQGLPTREAYQLAVKTAGCDNWIEKQPDKEYSVLEEGGGQLSGGQRQSLAIARALLLDRPITLLDEAFSSIDVNRIKNILESIHANYADKTFIIVTHDNDIVNDCDEKICLQQMG